MSEYANGTYTVEYTVTVAGLYYVMVTLGGEPIQGAPFRMQARGRLPPHFSLRHPSHPTPRLTPS